MADEARVATKLEQIEQYVGELETLSMDAYLSAVTERRAVERMFENVILSCADLAPPSPRPTSAMGKGTRVYG